MQEIFVATRRRDTSTWTVNDPAPFKESETPNEPVAAFSSESAAFAYAEALEAEDALVECTVDSVVLDYDE